MVKKLLMKKGILLLFACLLIVSPFSSLHNLAYAEKENENEEDLSQEIASVAGDFEIKEREDGSIIVTAYNGSDRNVEIPATFYGRTVTEIDRMAFEGLKLTSVTLPDTIEIIGYRAFMGNDLTSISLPEALEVIEDVAFKNNQLTELTIPHATKEIKSAAFENNQISELHLGSRLKRISNNSFKNNLLTSLVLPKVLEEINFQSFADNKLTEVTVLRRDLEFITRTDDNPFQGNQENPANLTIKGYDPSTAKDFAADSGFTFEALADDDQEKFIWEENDDGTLTLIGYVGSDSDIIIPATIDGKTVTKIGEGMFFNKGINSVDLPVSLQEIGDQAFFGNELTEITIPKSVKSIGYRAFYKNNLTKVTIPENVERLNNGAFENNRLEEIEFNKGKDLYVDAYAFKENALNNLTLPERVYHIGYNSFYNNPLKEVTIMRFDANLDKDFLPNLFNKTIHIKGYAGSTAEEHALSSPRNFTFETLDIDASKFTWEENDSGITITGYKGNEEVLLIPKEIDQREVTMIGESAFENTNISRVGIPNSVTSIEAKAFSNARIESLNIPGSVKVIESHAFHDNRIHTLTLTNGLEEIGDYVFNLNNLETVSIPESVKSIGFRAFYQNDLKELTFEQGIEVIDQQAFAKNKLESLVLPESLETIGFHAFLENNLSRVTIYSEDVEISSNSQTAFGDNQADPSDLTFYAQPDSTTEQFARDNGFSFIAIAYFPDNYLKELINWELGLPKNLDPRVEDVEKLTSLLEGHAGSRDLYDITGLEYAVNLEELDLYRHYIKDITPLKGLTKLVKLFLGDHEIDDLQALANLTNLEILDLHWNEIEDISALTNLTKLEVLLIHGNKISNIEALENLTQLDELYLDGNSIYDFSPLKDIVGTLSNYDLGNQYIILEAVEILKTADTLTIDNPLINIDGQPIDNLDLGDGNYDNGKITWDNLNGTETDFFFSFSGDHGITGEVILPITWVVDELPVIHAEDFSILQGEDFDPLDYVTASDKESGDLTDDIIVIKNEVDPTTVGSYQVTYAVTDHGGQSVQTSITVKVVPKEVVVPFDIDTKVYAGQLMIVDETEVRVLLPGDLPFESSVLVTDLSGEDFVHEAENLELAGEAINFSFNYPDAYTGNFSLSMDYDDSSGHEVDIYYFNEDERKWEKQNGTIDKENQTLTIETNSFSSYGVFAVDEEESEDPTDPTDPEEPEDPTEPVDPEDPEDPTEPVDPEDPEDPTEPVDPEDPEDPTEPVDPEDPEDPTEPVDPEDPEGSKDSDEEEKEGLVDEDEEDEAGIILPKTATNFFNYMLFGLILLIGGGILIEYMRRKTLE